MPSLSNSNAGQMSTITWGQAKGQVAQVVGGQNDPEVLEAAEAQITAVFQDWNTSRNWQFLQTLAPDIAITSGTSSYDLPAPFKKPYAALLVTASRPLYYLTRRQYNLIDPDQSATQPSHYTLFNVGTTGQIELIPPNGVNDTLRVWYYRLMSEGPTTDGDTLDVLGRYTNYLLDGARARLLALRGPTEKLPFWQQAASRGFMMAQADDEGIPDENTGFSPLHQAMSVPSPNSFDWVDWGW